MSNKSAGTQQVVHKIEAQRPGAEGTTEYLVQFKRGCHVRCTERLVWLDHIEQSADGLENFDYALNQYKTREEHRLDDPAKYNQLKKQDRKKRHHDFAMKQMTRIPRLECKSVEPGAVSRRLIRCVTKKDYLRIKKKTLASIKNKAFDKRNIGGRFNPGTPWDWAGRPLLSRRSKPMTRRERRGRKHFSR